MLEPVAVGGGAVDIVMCDGTDDKRLSGEVGGDV